MGQIENLYEQYEELGYFVTDVMWDNVTLSQLKDEVELLMKEHDGNQNPILFMDNLEYENALFSSFIRSKPYRLICNALLGENISALHNSAVIKFNSKNSYFNWHQNECFNYYSNIRIEKHLTCFTPLVDITKGNGCLSIIPQTHKLGYIQHQLVSRELSNYRLDNVDESNAIPIEMQAGQILVIHPLTFHSSYPNNSPAPRITYIPIFHKTQDIIHNGKKLSPPIIF